MVVSEKMGEANFPPYCAAVTNQSSSITPTERSKQSERTRPLQKRREQMLRSIHTESKECDTQRHRHYQNHSHPSHVPFRAFRLLNAPIKKRKKDSFRKKIYTQSDEKKNISFRQLFAFISSFSFMLWS